MVLLAEAVLAVLYDIHGNLAALEAVLEDARHGGVRRFVLGGDYALFGPWPDETVTRLRELDATWIRGNGERWTAHPEDAPEHVQAAVAACREALGTEAVEELAALPEEAVLDETRFCHASPGSDLVTFLPDPADDEDGLLRDVSEPRLVFGHSHLPFRRTASTGVELINPGSVGMPFDGDPRAAYALMADDGRVEHRRVEYDHAASAAAVRERFPEEWSELVARRIETARFDA